MVNSKRKNMQRSLMEELYIGNLTNDTIKKEILGLLSIRAYSSSLEIDLDHLTLIILLSSFL